MKKMILLLAFAALTAAATAFAGSVPGTGINGSPHDITAKVPGSDVMGRTCVFCHTPHNAANGQSLVGTDLPLWNHTLSTNEGTWVSYQWAGSANVPVYDGGGNKTSGLDPILDPVQGPSRLCLSCHDGSINYDQHGTDPTNTNAANYSPGTVKLSGAKQIGAGGDLTTSHPIGFSYGAALTQRGSTELAAKTEGWATAINPDALWTAAGKVTRSSTLIGTSLYQGDVMTCATCHDVHNKDNVAPAPSYGAVTANYFLYAQDESSLICLSCHKK